MTAAAIAVYFDFDGTLVDTLPGLVVGVNALRASCGLEPAAAATVRQWIGGGIEALLALAVAGRAPVDAQLRQRFLEGYRGAPLLDSLPFPGVPAMLDRLASLPLALVTNKARPSVDALIERLGWRTRFCAIVTPDDVAARKPDPEFMRAAAAQMPPVARAVMVGDGEFDVAAAHAAHMTAVAVTWGYRDRSVLRAARPHVLIDHPDALTLTALRTWTESRAA